MSRINDLIQELCPNGVVYKPLNNLLNYEQPTKYIVNTTDYDSTPGVPVLTPGHTFILGYTKETDGIYQADKTNPTIIFDDFTTAFKWVDFPFKVKSSAMKMLSSRGEISLRFAWYAMQTIRYNPQNHARQWIKNYSAFEIPVPPMPVQNEIVGILDSFTSLEAELEAELEARQEQYCYYRNDIISKCTSSCKRMPLSDIGMLIRGHGMTKSDFTDKGIGAIHYGQLYTTFDMATDSVISYVSPAIAQSLLTVNPGNLIISNTSENLDDVGKAVAWLGDNQIVTGGHATVLRHNQNPKYLAYWFQTPDFQLQKRKYAAGTKVIELPAKALDKIVIPLPSLSEQSRIVSELDKFRLLNVSMSSGLPAEIEARHKQYEYYRDRLLTFKELDHE